MYSAHIEYLGENFEQTIKKLKVPLGKHVIAELGKIENGEPVIIETFDNWLEAHAKVDELNKKNDGKQYGVFNDEGAKTRGPEDINPGSQQEEE